jgi:hypothetical protein
MAMVADQMARVTKQVDEHQPFTPSLFLEHVIVFLLFILLTLIEEARH